MELESGLLLGTACLIGAGFALLGQVLLDRALQAIAGFPAYYAIAAPTAIRVLATGLAVAVLAVPGWLAVRIGPDEKGAGRGLAGPDAALHRGQRCECDVG
jgi:hypothetical protein